MYLIKKNVEVNAQNNKEWTPIHRFITDGHIYFVQYLVDNITNMDAINYTGKFTSDFLKKSQI